MLLEEHPKIAAVNCAFCEKYRHDSSGNLQTYHGEPQLNGPKGPICRRNVPSRCPKGTPENSKALNAINQQVLEHYELCEAIGHFPDDPVVAFHAKHIRKYFKRQRERREMRYLRILARR